MENLLNDKMLIENGFYKEIEDVFSYDEWRIKVDEDEDTKKDFEEKLDPDFLKKVKSFFKKWRSKVDVFEVERDNVEEQYFEKLRDDSYSAVYMTYYNWGGLEGIMLVCVKE